MTLQANRVAIGKYDASDALIFLFALLATLPVWLSMHAPMVDLPQHAGQVRLLDEVLNGEGHAREWFQINWFTPYLAVYLGMWLLAKFTGIALACKLSIASVLFLAVMSMRTLLREVGGDVRWALAIIPGLYGFSYQWGFLNYLLGVPLGLYFLAYSIRYGRNPTLRGGLLLAALGNALFFVHFLILGFFGAIAGLMYLVNEGLNRRWWMRAWPLFATLPVIVFWASRTLADERQTTWPKRWQVGWHRLPDLVIDFFGTPLTLAMLLLFVLLLAMPWLLGGRPSRQLSRWVPLLACLLASFLVPNFIFGAFYIYQRFAVFLIPFLLLGFDLGGRGVAPRIMLGVLVAIASLWITTQSFRALNFDRESADFEPVVEAMQPGKRALSLVLIKESYSAPVPLFLHYPLWYQSAKGGVVDFNFARNYNQLVRYQAAEMESPIGHDFVWSPEEFDWYTYGGALYDYIVLRAPADVQASPMNLKIIGCHVRVVLHSGTWWLYETTREVPADRKCEP